MQKVRISENFEIVIPVEVREQLNLRPGQELDVFVLEDIIEVVPVRPIQEFRGMLRHVTAEFDRDAEYR
jgi:AbrB family looped-hinge helix DNA binding protein